MRVVRHGFLIVVALLALSSTAPAQSTAPDPLRLEAFVDGAVRQAMDAQHVAGMTVAVTGREGPLLLKGYGIARHGRSVDAATLFRMGSISKTVTWIAIMQLVEQHKLTLDDPVNAHLPHDLQIPGEGFREPIRIRHLMTHTAGFEDATLGVNVTQDVRRLLPLREYLKRYRVHRVRPPGVLAVYSNYGAALAGAIVEHESGMPYADYVERNILRPLDMQTATFREPYPASLTRSGFAAPMSADVESHASSGFKYADGKFVEQSWEFLPHMAPAGAMSASARDMSAYLQALLDPVRFERAHVLHAATVLAMREPTFRNDPRLGANRHGFWEVPDPSGQLAFGHNGAMAFQQTDMVVYPGRNIAIFVAVNSASLNGGPSPIVSALPRLIMAEFFGSRTAKRASVAAGESQRYAGCYRPLRRPYHHTERALFAIAQTGCITVRANGDLLLGTQTYVPVGNGVYAKPDLTDRIAFETRDGRMLLFNFDSSGPAERIGYFQTVDWLLFAGALALVVAVLRLLGGFVRLLSGRETRAFLLVDGLSVLWLVALVLFGVAAMPWLSDFSEPILHYPGVLFPIVCWLLLGAALATIAVALALLLVVRPSQWPWLTRIGAGLTLAIFIVFAVTLQTFHLLGFSGW